jgi:DNA/RNA endonuclease YhcR with UshA esterase domain
MKQFFQNNKIFIGIIIAAIIIGGFVYLSNKSTIPTPPPEKETGSTSDTLSPETSPSSECIDYTEAENHVGEQGCVTGRVDNVYTSDKGNNFLNFCPNYKTCPFSAVIFNTDAHKFSNIKGYDGKIVEITGLIKTYQGNAEIIISDPGQIKTK